MTTRSTLHTVKTPDGTPLLMPNVTTNFNGFYISYNNYDRAIHGSDTTALVVGQMQHFYILNGDHRIPLIEAANNGGLDACMDYFLAHIDQIGKYSDRPAQCNKA